MSAVKTATVDRRIIIDEYGELCRQIASHAPAVARHKQVAAIIQGWYAGASPLATFQETGKRYTLQVSPCKTERKIASMGKLFALLGKLRFLRLAKITLADLDANVSAEDAQALTKTAPTGHRALKVVPLQ